VSRIHRTRATAHEFVKTPLPFPDTRSHICLKLGREAVDGCQCGARIPNEDAVSHASRVVAAG